VLNSESPSIAIADDKRDKAADTALYGALVYLGFIGVSIICCVAAKFKGEPHQVEDAVRFQKQY
jgi:hypothetical protein